MDNREDSLYESFLVPSEIVENPYDIAKENDYNLHSTIKQEAKLLKLFPQKTTKLEGRAFTKMDNIFFPDLNGPFDLEDIFPDDPWIDNTDFPVQNLEIPERNVVTAQEVLEETILSPGENLLGTTEELYQFFPEQFINLATMESNMNSFNSDPTAGYMATDNMIMANFDDLLANAKQEVPALACEPSPILDILHDNVFPKLISEFDSTAAVVPDVIPETPPSLPESPVDTTDSGVFANDFSLDLNQLDPAIVALLENLERSVSGETNVERNSRKRPLVVQEEVGNPVEDVCKKKKPQSCSSTDDETVPDKIVERRMKNNVASRVCRASRKARHNEVFEQEKELAKENEELTAKVEELSATVEYLRNYLVMKLSGRCN